MKRGDVHLSIKEVGQIHLRPRLLKVLPQRSCVKVRTHLPSVVPWVDSGMA
jgi:hypothetical protein